MICSACHIPNVSPSISGLYLCERCDVIARREFPHFPVDSSSPGKAPAVVEPQPGSAAGAINFDLDIPAFLKRDQNNVPAYARAA